MTPADFWAGSLAEAWIYIDVDTRRRDDRRTLTAWQIASAANIAGARPKVTVASLLKEKRPMTEQPMLASMLSGISKPKDGSAPKKKDAAPTKEEAQAQLDAFNAAMRDRMKATPKKENVDVPGKNQP